MARSSPNGISVTNYTWAAYQSATGCTKYGPAGAEALMVYLEDLFPGQTSFGICNCREVRGGSSWSHHAECRAYDEGFAVFAGQTIGIRTLELLGPHGARLGLDHMIANHEPGASDRGDPRIYSARSPQGRTYTGAHPHKNHNHIGLTRSAGRNLTYATLVAVVGHPNKITPTKEQTLERGDKGKAVAELQHAGARFWKWANGTWAPFAGRSDFDGQTFGPGQDGSFGGTSEGNVKAFQKTMGLPETGVVDGVTAAMIFAPYGSGGGTVDLSGLATKTELANHAKTKASGSVHPHNHGGPQ